ncbi:MULTISPECIES: PadR family transcriptional regulator [unclassified Janthinobacterium]|uniref:PadR family transcriptional regulator n=1 Tax=unclassified Janthinobacterium TaxID=2610881 RepID=UPI000C16B6F4|nr:MULTISPECIES: PadR family transcriptional regulator [unclassified Janthinobacterium]MDN2677786.1 PadR family transcriptional regulator [Janthinobacterium sp. SUN033]MDO8066845.1 PadR family transcriptional regulator [Janthinobacterium sp. SUN206]MDO8073119.1 PadR family transcriptional regulator [Janthinobacterium sp. SUN176]PIF11541.1 PadR family transcriptional regulator [Janthinobacterium sp. 13]
MRNSHHAEHGHGGHHHHHGHCGQHHHHGEHRHEHYLHGRGPRGFDERGDGMGPGGPGGRGGRGERAERVFGRGDLPLIVLALIEISPRHGYEIIKAIEERCGGAYAPSPGAVYPTLTLLEEQDHVTSSESASGKKLYTITDLGRAYLDENRAQVDGILARLDMFARVQARNALPERVRQAMHTLKHALLLNKTNWSDAEAERVSAVLEQAANAIVDGH